MTRAAIGLDAHQRPALRDTEAAARDATAYMPDTRLWRAKADLAELPYQPSPLVWAITIAIAGIVGWLSGAWVPLP